MDIVTTGPRECEANPIIKLSLAHLQTRLGSNLLVVQGAARGADRHVRNACAELGITCRNEPAWWGAPCDLKSAFCRPNHRRIMKGRSTGDICPAAGLRRNQYMLRRYRPPIVIAFLDRDEPTPGTRDMIERSTQFGAWVVVIDVRRDLAVAVRQLDEALDGVGL